MTIQETTQADMLVEPSDGLVSSASQAMPDETVSAETLGSQPLPLSVSKTSRSGEFDGGSLDVQNIYARQASRYELLSPEDEIRLGKLVFDGEQAKRRINSTELSQKEAAELAKVIEAGDVAFKQFTEANLRLVMYILRKCSIPRYIPTPDLIQAGNIGLMKAVRNYDYRTGFKFASLAKTYIYREIIRTAQTFNALIHLPVGVAENIRKINDTRFQITAMLGRDPSDQEVASYLGIPVEVVQEASSLDYQLLSLDGQSYEEDPEFQSGANNGQTETAAIGNQLREFVTSLVTRNSTSRDAKIVLMHFGFRGEPYNFNQIGEHFGLTRERVRQIVAMVLRDMREEVASKGYELSEWA
ncbi:MAG: sigma-70 family RNA polymerase sigma factor [Candidatus Saccharimonadales bacterium]